MEKYIRAEDESIMEIDGKSYVSIVDASGQVVQKMVDGKPVLLAVIDGVAYVDDGSPLPPADASQGAGEQGVASSDSGAAQ